jgi:hypothetical protein
VPPREKNTRGRCRRRYPHPPLASSSWPPKITMAGAGRRVSRCRRSRRWWPPIRPVIGESVNQRAAFAIRGHAEVLREPPPHRAAFRLTRQGAAQAPGARRLQSSHGRPPPDTWRTPIDQTIFNIFSQIRTFGTHIPVPLPPQRKLRNRKPFSAFT